ncbi:Uncharacterized protein FWK35_00038971 [Aphis craccivora]|uniref:Uncharacterized protein n=1 Tax=Aphis craccivora TaxID=307492 RepID=A0A6G0YHJ3_APHCR|nr:Uncharacterized protein FWK35_00038971 [Aphis craccivora]
MRHRRHGGTNAHTANPRHPRGPPQWPESYPPTHTHTLLEPPLAVHLLSAASQTPCRCISSSPLYIYIYIYKHIICACDAPTRDIPII